MKKKTYESFGELQKMICDFIEERFQNGDYKFRLIDKYYDSHGYADGCIIIGGYEFKCSVNVNNFICWHCDIQLEQIIDNMPRLAQTICKETNTILKKEADDIRKMKIEKLEQELKQLKSEIK